MRVVLSHNARDFDLIRALQRDAEQLGIETYAFEHDPQPGTSLAKKIIQRVQESDVMVVLLSRHGAGSPYVHQEVGAALAARKTIVPIVERGVRKDVLAMLQGVEYIPLDPGQPVGARRLLLTSLRKMKIRAEQKRRDELVVAVGLLGLMFLVASRS